MLGPRRLPPASAPWHTAQSPRKTVRAERASAPRTVADAGHATSATRPDTQITARSGAHRTAVEPPVRTTATDRAFPACRPGQTRDARREWFGARFRALGGGYPRRSATRREETTMAAEQRVLVGKVAGADAARRTFLALQNS